MTAPTPPEATNTAANIAAIRDMLNHLADPVQAGDSGECDWPHRLHGNHGFYWACPVCSRDSAVLAEALVAAGYAVVKVAETWTEPGWADSDGKVQRPWGTVVLADDATHERTVVAGEWRVRTPVAPTELGPSTPRTNETDTSVVGSDG